MTGGVEGCVVTCEQDVPNACMTSGIESKAGCDGVEFARSVALPLTPFVPLAGSPFTNSAVILAGVTFLLSLFVFFLSRTLSFSHSTPTFACILRILCSKTMYDAITAVIARPVWLRRLLPWQSFACLENNLVSHRISAQPRSPGLFCYQLARCGANSVVFVFNVVGAQSREMSKYRGGGSIAGCRKKAAGIGGIVL